MFSEFRESKRAMSECIIRTELVYAGRLCSAVGPEGHRGFLLIITIKVSKSFNERNIECERADLAVAFYKMDILRGKLIKTCILILQ